jgi:type IV conjugative transfer system coupling protein TraD
MQEQDNLRHYTRGGQISFHRVHMWDQITKNVILSSLVFGIIVGAFYLWYKMPYERLTHAAAFYFAQMFSLVKYDYIFHLSFLGKIYGQHTQQILANPYFASTADYILTLVIKALSYGFGASITSFALSSFYFIKKGKKQITSKFIRGYKFLDARKLTTVIAKDRRASDIKIDTFPLLKNSELQHILVHGTTGTGKSQLIMKILDALKKRGDRVIIYDKGCAFISHYYDDNQDVILNPFDSRCPSWDLWSEVSALADFDNMAESLIPMHGETDPFWVNAARTVFAETAKKVSLEPEPSLAKLLNLLICDDFPKLEAYLQGTAASTLVSSKAEKTAISIRSVMTTYLKALTPLLDNTSAFKFSIKDYIVNPDSKGWLFISSSGNNHASLKPLISMWLALASLSLLSLTPDSKRRIWLICDELPSLHKLPQLAETIAEVRKFGGCFLLGMQSVAQLHQIYGHEGAKALFDLLNTRFFFRSASFELAKIVSSELGEEDISEARENYSYGANSMRDGISLSEQRVTRPIVSPSEILQLKNLECFVRLPEAYPVTKLTLKFQEKSGTPRAKPETATRQIADESSNSTKILELEA